MRDLAQAFVEPAREELVAGLDQHRDRGVRGLERVELGIDQAIERSRRDRQLGEERGRTIASAPAPPGSGGDELACRGGTERGERILGGSAHVVVGLAERAGQPAQIVGFGRAGDQHTLEHRAVEPDRRGDLRCVVTLRAATG